MGQKDFNSFIYAFSVCIRNIIGISLIFLIISVGKLIFSIAGKIDKASNLDIAIGNANIQIQELQNKFLSFANNIPELLNHTSIEEKKNSQTKDKEIKASYSSELNELKQQILDIKPIKNDF